MKQALQVEERINNYDTIINPYRNTSTFFTPKHQHEPSPQSWRISRILSQLGHIYNKQQEYEQADTVLERAEKMIVEINGDECTMV